MSENDGKKINKLEGDIYSRNFKADITPVRPPLTGEHFDVNKNWKHDMPFEPASVKPQKVAGSFFKIIMGIAALFFLITAGFATYSIISNWSTISKEKVDISFVGPVSVAAGQELAFDIVAENKNNSSISDVDLYIDYPDGTKSSLDITQDLSYSKETIGEIDSGATIRKASRSILFGAEHSIKEIRVTLDYGIKGSNARYKKEKIYSVTISSAPLSLGIEHVGEAVTGQDVEFKITLRSNSNTALTNLLLKSEYPFGFTPREYSPELNKESNAWLIESMTAGEEKIFYLKGRIDGEEGDVRAFRFMVGTRSTKDNQSIATAFLSNLETIAIRKPPIGVKFSLSGIDRGDVAVRSGETVSANLEISNNLQSTLVDAEISAVFSGIIFDYESPQPNSGFYRSVDKTIVWDKSMIADLAKLEPGSIVSTSFSFKTLPDPIDKIIKNGTMKVVVSVTGKQLSESGVGQVVNTKTERLVKSLSSVTIAPRLVYSVGPFQNSGPYPPKVDTPTTYTVVLSAKAGSNDVQDTEVRAVLPSYVEWLGVTNPTDQVTWNPDRNEVVWRVGTMSAGTGLASSAREASFQVSFTPSISQLGEAPILMRNITINAKDAFTAKPIGGMAGDITTRLPSDPKYSSVSGVVVR